MKKNDVALIIFVIAVTALVTYFGAQSLIGNKVGKSVNVETAEAINPTVTKPEARIFHKDAINPTVKIEIGGTVDQPQPFNN